MDKEFVDPEGLVDVWCHGIVVNSTGVLHTLISLRTTTHLGKCPEPPGTKEQSHLQTELQTVRPRTKCPSFACIHGHGEFPSDLEETGNSRVQENIVEWHKELLLLSGDVGG